jgi:hypothetical protein
MLLCLYIFAFSATCFASFSDVQEHWCEKMIGEFEESGFVQGYDDGTFRPDNDITKAEFCKVVNSYMGYDVSGDWQSANVDMAKEKGYLVVDNADDKITREEAFVALSKVMKLDNVEIDVSFGDSDEVSVWALPAVKSLVVNKYIKGYPDNNVKPKQNMKRAELVVILYQYVGIGGLDVDEPNFAVGYMDHNDYGLEFKEITDKIEIEVGDILTLAATAKKVDGDVVFEVIKGENVVEYDGDFMTLEALIPGNAEIKATTTESKQEKNIKVIVK